MCDLHMARVQGQTREGSHAQRAGLYGELPKAVPARPWGGRKGPHSPRGGPGPQRGLCSVHTTFFCSSAMAKRTQQSRVSRSLQASGARLLCRQGALSSSPSSCLLASRSCSSEVPSRCRAFLQEPDGGEGSGEQPPGSPRVPLVRCPLGCFPGRSAGPLSQSCVALPGAGTSRGWHRVSSWRPRHVCLGHAGLTGSSRQAHPHRQPPGTPT